MHKGNLLKVGIVLLFKNFKKEHLISFTQQIIINKDAKIQFSSKLYCFEIIINKINLRDSITPYSDSNKVCNFRCEHILFTPENKPKSSS